MCVFYDGTLHLIRIRLADAGRGSLKEEAQRKLRLGKRDVPKYLETEANKMVKSENWYMCPDENREVAKHLETDANKMVKKREYFIWKMRPLVDYLASASSLPRIQRRIRGWAKHPSRQVAGRRRPTT